MERTITIKELQGSNRNNFFGEAFEGYNIPENIKILSIEICNRFAITGICDPMYISNLIAVENNIGDGKGNFTDNTITKTNETAKKIQWAYGCNITKDEIPEIEFCLENGFMDSNKAISGLHAFKKRVKREIQTAEEWRKDYLKRKLLEINHSINLYTNRIRLL